MHDKCIVHLSDLHFGTEKPCLLPALLEDIANLKPTVIVISGDLTQRARHSQYVNAKLFLSNFAGIPVLTVPGNHDISLYNLLERFLYPFAKYKKWISPICSSFVDDQLAILGINSVTPYKPMSGYVSDKTLALVTEFFQHQPPERVRIICMHHNLIRSERHKIINDAEKIINLFSQTHISLVLSGHIHEPHIELLKRDYLSHYLYIITAGTAISTRTVYPNSYNLIEIREKRFKFTVRSFNGEAFIAEREEVLPL